MTTLSEDEVQLYDRGIRLWGVDGQQRLRNSRIAVIGFSSTAAEVCKNVVLAGIKQLCVVYLEDGDGDERETTGHLFGTSRPTDSAISSVRELNPLVSVDVVRVNSKLTSFSSVVTPQWILSRGFDICVSCSMPFPVASAVDSSCRAVGIPFISSHSFGEFALLFCDIPSVAAPAIAPRDPPSPKRQKSADRPIPLAEAITVPWVTLKRLRASNLHFAINVLLRRQQRQQEPPSLVASAAEFAKILASEPGSGVDLGLLDLNVLEDVEKQEGREFAPVCAVIGGIAAQEAIKEIMRDRSSVQQVVEQRQKPGTSPVPPPPSKPIRSILAFNSVDCTTSVIDLSPVH